MAGLLLLRKRIACKRGATSCRRAWSSCSDSSSKNSILEDLPPLDISHPAVTVWGANTNVGKTLISAGLSASLLSSGASVSYLKPLQTGFPHDSDSRFVVNKVRHTLPNISSKSLKRVFVSHGIQHVSPSVLAYAPYPPKHGVPSHQARSSIGKDFYSYEKFVLEANCNVSGAEWLMRAPNEEEQTSAATLSSTFQASTLWSWFHAVSPHIASAKEGLSVTDSTVLSEVASSILAFSKASTGLPSRGNGPQRWTIVETAGGVASPGPTGTLQCDLYRPFRLPSLLVGDGKLGGISSTITAYESLISRGYDVDAIVLIDHHLGNGDQLRDYMRDRLPIVVFPSIPEDLADDLVPWFTRTASIFNQLQDHLKAAHGKKLTRLRDMQKKAGQYLWWPFTQHSFVPEGQVTVIDARVGDSFMIYKNVSDSDLIMRQFDGCASWWTQGPDLSLQLELARQVGYATGRFGHVMLPENVYEPALRCAESLIKLIGKGWANRVYYSDNGSTSVEIAIKMAFRKYSHDHQLLTKSASQKKTLNMKVLALRDSYHGDTLGAQEAQAPTAYTGFLQQPWYQGRGLFLDPPYVFMRNGKWQIDIPRSYMESRRGSACVENVSYLSRSDLFDEQRDHSELATLYRELIRRRMASCGDASTHLAALILEPVIHAAGGMALVDPLFQRLLVKECKSQKIPVIFDEVFSGCWRLGVQSCAEYLGCTPDIGCYSKLLTGGVVPLAVTLASSAVFDAFKGDSKLLALLHGHSYSGHAVGCQAAHTSLQWLSDPKTNPNLVPSTMRLVELWDPDRVAELSAHPEVHRVIALGTVFALELKANASDSGYASMLSQSIVQALRENGIYNRPLGNVIYFMCGPTTPPPVCTKLLLQLSHQLDDFAAKKQAAAVHACA